MSQRSKRGFVNKIEVLEKLSAGRAGAIQTHREAKINSPEYRAASGVTEAIDRLAEELTGDPKYFHIKMATNDQQPNGFTPREE